MVWPCLNIKRFLSRFPRNRRRRTLLILLCFMTVLLYNIPNRFEFRNSNVYGLCALPEVDPFDPEIMQFDDHPDPVTCENILSMTYIDMQGFLQFNTTALSIQSLKKADLDCAFSPVERNGDFNVAIKPEVRFVDPVYIQNDVIVVRCRDKSQKVIYENIHINIDYKTVLRSKNIQQETGDQFSILIFGIDSISKNMALRKIPKTMHYFEDVLDGITFKGYTKVGENTFHNLVPLLTGKRAEPEDFGHLWNAPTYDNWPFIVHNYSKAGYATLFAEDVPYINTFNYGKSGFVNPPSDHYIRTMYLAMNKLQPMTSFHLVFLYLENKDIKFKSSSLCYGNKLKHHLYLEYIRRFMHVYKHKRKFAFTWMNELSHEYPKYLELADQDFVDFLKWMKDDGHLEHTLLLFMSDHGSRTDEIRNTVPGRIEVRMPLLSIVLPDALKRQYPDIVETMRDNTKVITTPFDVYALMSDVLHRRFDQTIRVMEDGKLPRGIGLFRKIPKERTCADASINEEFCACFSSKSIDIKSKPVQLIAAASVKKINHLLGKFKDKCAHLMLSKIRDAQLIKSNFKRDEVHDRFTLNNIKPTEDKEKYIVLLETSPGSALFEATASLDQNDDVIMTGEILRSNKYGNQSQCIVDRSLRTYCFCT